MKTKTIKKFVNRLKTSNGMNFSHQNHQFESTLISYEIKFMESLKNINMHIPGMFDFIHQ